MSKISDKILMYIYEINCAFYAHFFKVESLLKSEKVIFWFSEIFILWNRNVRSCILCNA